ncbi:ADP-ribosylation Crystallin J1 [Micractinium conductrix]|uniref:ADP-ribosylation Crystallin J1 n=1 Tax=Micractinium conductrix TaxID=554055 RepID=A0A2P6VGF4_9CHLO|nr:ADP-ribosylation Crystallin J1 [Micractinium conductrix]|eukprot:PSC73170.1 ADP-ribosylation Crystallin J1 [Micractinium conductrix]
MQGQWAQQWAQQWAVGAYLEFDEVTPQALERALMLPGGGCWNVGPGQFTDDTELALCQAHGLAGHAPSGGLPASAVAREYAWWCNKSEPFDVGATTHQAFSLDFAHTTDFAAAVQANVCNAGSLGSKANGATMRGTPLAIWAHTLSVAAAAEAAMQDAALSHPSKACQHANAAYVLAVAALVRRPGDAEGAVAVAEGWAAAHASAEERGWLADARDDGAAWQATRPQSRSALWRTPYG